LLEATFVITGKAIDTRRRITSKRVIFFIHLIPPNQNSFP
jgi:hypothetical protein